MIGSPSLPARVQSITLTATDRARIELRDLFGDRATLVRLRSHEIGDGLWCVLVLVFDRLWVAAVEPDALDAVRTAGFAAESLDVWEVLP